MCRDSLERISKQQTKTPKSRDPSPETVFSVSRSDTPPEYDTTLNGDVVEVGAESMDMDEAMMEELAGKALQKSKWNPAAKEAFQEYFGLVCVPFYVRWWIVSWCMLDPAHRTPSQVLLLSHSSGKQRPSKIPAILLCSCALGCLFSCPIVVILSPRRHVLSSSVDP